MTVTSIPSSTEVQALIDARLDTIDRMLLGRVARGERLDIVREVESQIHELLQQRGGEEPGREDVLAVLARLDPPEAYLGDEDRSTPAVTVRSPSAATGVAAHEPGLRRVGRVGGYIGLGSFGAILLIPFAYLVAEFSSSEILLIIGGGGLFLLAFVGGIAGVAMGIYTRCCHSWAIAGLVAGTISIITSLFGAGFLLTIFLS